MASNSGILSALHGSALTGLLSSEPMPVSPAASGTSILDSTYRWAIGGPPASYMAGLGPLGSTLWCGLSYSGPSSAPWQGIVGSFGAGVLAAPFEAYENYTLYRQSKRSLSHSLLDGVSDTLSAGAASYLGSSLSSLIISSALGRAAPIRGTLGAGLFAAAIGFGAWHVLSAIKEGVLKDAGIA